MRSACMFNQPHRVLLRMLFLHNFERFNNLHSYHGRVGGNQLPPISLLLSTANDWPQHAASCHILPKLAAITIKVGALLQDEGPWFFTLFSREEPPFPLHFLMKFSQKMLLYLFYTMVHKKSKMKKTQI